MEEKYEIRITKRSLKNIGKLPEKDRRTFTRLLFDIERTGPVQPSYQNFGRLGKNRYHCHLSYHWVACWECRSGKYVVEVYYVGSRESAPY